MAEINMKSLALSFGITWGASLFLLGIITWLIPGWGSELVSALGSLYRGYNASLIGALLGLVWGFADGAIAGLLIAWLYNGFSEE